MVWCGRSLLSVPHRRMECRSGNVRDARDHLFPSDPNARPTLPLVNAVQPKGRMEGERLAILPTAPPFRMCCTCMHAWLATTHGMDATAIHTCTVSCFRSNLLGDSSSLPFLHDTGSSPPFAGQARVMKNPAPSWVERVATDRAATRSRSRFGRGRSRKVRRHRRWCAKQHWWWRRGMEMSIK